jgi:predicted glycoside hydrolase/deacetylase ChbG (UPF0249 family)
MVPTVDTRYETDQPSFAIGKCGKSVSWAPISHVSVIDNGEILNEYGHQVEKFVMKLRKSPKHADTIYVYEKPSTVIADEDNEEEGFSFLEYQETEMH